MYPANGTRDLIGYGRTPPGPQWPNGARVALNFVLNIEEGSEYSIENGDGLSEASLTEMGTARCHTVTAIWPLNPCSSTAAVSASGVFRPIDIGALPLTGFACAMVL